MSLVLALQLAIALPLMLFVPGFFAIRATLPRQTRMEALTLAPTISLALTALALLGIENTAERFTAENVTLTVLGLNAACALLAWLRRRFFLRR